MSTPMTILSWALRLLVAAILFQTLYFKFTGAEESVYIFSTLGLEPWGRIGSGVAELIAVLLLLWPRTVPLGALLALGVISGALVSHLTKLGIVVKDDGGLLFGLAVVVFVGSAALAWLHRAELPVVGPRLGGGPPAGGSGPGGGPGRTKTAAGSAEPMRARGDSGPRRILILGGGFGGVYAALELERRLRRDERIEITLVNRENFFLFTPMLHEVAASDLDLTNIVSPIRKLLRRTGFFEGEVRSVDLVARTARLRHGSDGHEHEVAWDQLVVALGSSTNFFGLPGVPERALTMKSLGDAMRLRNRMIACLEEADTECAAAVRRRLTTFVVAGAGFAGVETIAGMNDFLREALRWYPRLSAEDLRLVLVHPGELVLPELGPALGRYAQTKLAARGVEILSGARVEGCDAQGVRLADGTCVPTQNLVWTAGTAPHELLASLPARKEKGRLLVEETLAVPGHPGVWALGDAAAVPDRRTGGFHPPTAQHALRQARTAARNALANLRDEPLAAFDFATLGQLAAIGRRTGVARVFGINFSGFVAWWLWRTIYLGKLPRIEKKLRVMLDWTLDVLFSKDLVQYLGEAGPAAPPAEPTPASAEPRMERALV